MSQAFIGCKISLISKSEIRYEGILYTIDTKESTIALSKVRSFGTEERKTDKPVAPRNEVYEYIIFRASDIKDLIVDDPPAVASTGLSDPAIIQAQSVGAPSTSQASTTYTVLPGTSISTTTSAGATKQPTLANVLNAGNQSKASDTVVRSRGPSPNVQRKSPANEQKQQERRNQQRSSDQVRGDGQRSVFNNNRGGSGRDGGPRRDVNVQQPQQPQHRQLPQQQQQQPHQQQQQRPYQNRQFPNPQQQQYGHQNREYQNRDGGQQRGGRGGYRDALQNAPRPGQGGYRNNQHPHQQQGYNNRPRPQSFNQNRPPRTDVTKLEEYDFEKANQEFTELESKFEKLDVAPESKPDNDTENVDTSTNSKTALEDDDAFYDKKKSFFDSISCEALERSKGNVQRIDRGQERKLNQETFGVAGIRGRGGYRRGYGRGGYNNNRNNYQRGGFNNSRGGHNRSFNNNRNDGEGGQQQQSQQEPRQSQPAPTAAW